MSSERFFDRAAIVRDGKYLMTQKRKQPTSIITIEQAGAHAGSTVTIRGWLYNLRESGKLLFPIFRDGTGIMQGVVSLKEHPEAFAR